jgi:glycosyl transferase, family 25
VVASTDRGSHALAAAFEVTFDRIYVINLRERGDRRLEITDQFAKIGVAIDGNCVSFYSAVRPTDQGNFPSIGARGCFMSHFGILEDAIYHGYKSILILEDDADWTNAALRSTEEFAQVLAQTPWMFLHGGLGGRISNKVSSIALIPLSPEQPMRLTHFIGLRGSAIATARHYFAAMLERPAGSALGGPMHVDGAYSWLRKAHPEINGYVCEPSLAKQRPSNSDVTPASGVKALPIVRDVLGIARKIRRLT